MTRTASECLRNYHFIPLPTSSEQWWPFRTMPSESRRTLGRLSFARRLNREELSVARERNLVLELVTLCCVSFMCSFIIIVFILLCSGSAPSNQLLWVGGAMTSRGGSRDMGQNNYSLMLLDFLKIQEDNRNEAEQCQWVEARERDAEFWRLQTELLKNGSKARAKEEDEVRKEAAEKRRKEAKVLLMAKLSEGEDLESFVDKLKDVLQRYDIAKEEWIDELHSKLTGTYREVVAELRALHADDYPTVKVILLKSAGLSDDEAALKVLALRNADIADYGVPQLIHTIRRLIKCWVPTVEDASLFSLLKGVTLSLLLKRAQSFLRTRDITTLERLTDSLHIYRQQYNSFGDNSFQQFKKVQQPQKVDSFKCFSCGEAGHKASTRPKKIKQEEATTQVESKEVKLIKCYACGVLCLCEMLSSVMSEKVKLHAFDGQAVCTTLMLM